MIRRDASPRGRTGRSSRRCLLPLGNRPQQAVAGALGQQHRTFSSGLGRIAPRGAQWPRQPPQAVPFRPEGGGGRVGGSVATQRSEPIASGVKRRQARHEVWPVRNRSHAPWRSPRNLSSRRCPEERDYFFLVAFLAPVLALGDFGAAVLVAAFLVAFFAAAMSTLLVVHDSQGHQNAGQRHDLGIPGDRARHHSLTRERQAIPQPKRDSTSYPPQPGRHLWRVK